MEARRYIVLGAGAIGCALGGLLLRSGASVALVARGAQLEALRARGLTLRVPSRTDVLPVSVLSGPASVEWRDGDVVILAVKSQDTDGALAELAGTAPRGTPIVCAQNGVVNERRAASLFERVYRMVVFVPAAYLRPGEVDVHSEPVPGGLDLGCWPGGLDDLAHAITLDLVHAGFDARVSEDIVRLAYGKLLTNLGNVLQAVAREHASWTYWLARAQEEAICCYHAASIAFAPVDELRARYASVHDLPVAGARRGGGSTWQSLARGTGTIEADALHGEIVRLGREWDVATPVNLALLNLAHRAATERWPPGHLLSSELDDMINSSVGAASARCLSRPPPRDLMPAKRNEKN